MHLYCFSQPKPKVKRCIWRTCEWIRQARSNKSVSCWSHPEPSSDEQSRSWPAASQKM